jgi:hypothetical protein
VRFFLDHDVDSAVATMLRRKRHTVWAAGDAALSRTTDDVLSVYADTKRAVLVTHDVEFTARRRAEPIGQHVRLACREWEAADVLARHLAALLAILRARPCVTVLVTKDAAPRILERDWRRPDS